MRVPHGNIRESKSVPTRVSSGRKMIPLWRPLPVFILICYAIQFARVVTYDFRRSIRRVPEMSGDCSSRYDNTRRVSDKNISHFHTLHAFLTRRHVTRLYFVTIYSAILAFLFIVYDCKICFIPWTFNLKIIFAWRVLLQFTNTVIEIILTRNV